ncbi:MAG: hypothetical protein MHM6MM_004024 [Cercozoa sp. M6MM]
MLSVSNVKRILIVEAGERFCWYGLSGIFVLFLTEALGYSESHATAVFSTVGAIAYLSPILGGYLSDQRWKSKYNTIVRFASVYWLGNIAIVLAGFTESRWITWLAIVLVASGNGGIKPLVSPFGAEQLPEGTSTTSYYTSFYASINLGSIGALLAVPALAQSAGFASGFLLSSVFFTFAMLVFLSGRNGYVKLRPKGQPLVDFYHVLRDWVRLRMGRSVQGFNALNEDASEEDNEDILQPEPSPVSSDNADSSMYVYESDKWAHLQQVHGPTKVVQCRKVLAACRVFLLLPLFWALYGQNASTWILQAKAMNRRVRVLGHEYEVSPGNIQVLNPLVVLLLLPLFDRVIYRRIAWLRESLLKRMTVGMFLCALAFFVSALAEDANTRAIERNNDDTGVSFLWQLPQYLVMGMAEVLVSVTGLEFAYQRAPADMRGIVQAFFLASMAFGHVISGVLFSALHDTSRNKMLYLFAILQAVNSCLFAWMFFSDSYSPGAGSVNNAEVLELANVEDSGTPGALAVDDGGLNEADPDARFLVDSDEIRGDFDDMP